MATMLLADDVFMMLWSIECVATADWLKTTYGLAAWAKP